MKRLLLISVALIAAGCTIDRRGINDPDVALEFQPAMYMHVAQEGVERYPQGQPFGVCSWKLPDGADWKESSSESQEYLREQEVSMSGQNVWSCPGTPLWPSKEWDLTFIAYSPYISAGGCTREQGVIYQLDDFRNDQTDFLYTSALENLDKTESGGVVTVPFRHALSQIEFRVKNTVSTDEVLTVRKISIDKIVAGGEFESLREPQWVTEGEPVELVFFEGSFVTGGLPEYIGRDWLVIPQTLDARVVVEFDFTDRYGKTVERKAETRALNLKLKPGSRYSLTLSIGMNDVKFLKEIIENRFNK